MKEFVNRREETDKLNDIVNSDFKVSVVYSHEGIGKSCFIENFIKNFLNDKAIIIKNEELDFGSNIEKYFFANKIFEEIIKRADKTKISLLWDKISKFFNVTPSISLPLFSFELDLDINEKFRLYQDLIIKLLEEQKNRIIIYIDNIEKIDYQSIIFISQLLDKTSNLFFILEFKLLKEEKYPIKLIEQLKNNKISYNCIELRKLSIEHTYKVMQNNDLENIDKLIGDYDSFDGNLKQVILMNEKNDKKCITLDKDAYFLLEFIDLTKGELSCDEIYEVIHSYPAANRIFLPLNEINGYIDEMHSEHLVNLNFAQKIYITSLGKKVMKKDNESLITAMLSNYYIPIIINDKAEQCLQGLKILLPLLTKNADSQITKILPSLHNNIVLSRCNKKIIDDIYDNIDYNSDNDDVRIELIKLYISFGDYKTAFCKIKKLIDNANDETKVLYATLISHICSVETAETKVIELLSQVHTKEARSAIQTCLVSLYMKINNSENVLRYVKHLKEDNKITEIDLKIINKNISIYYDFQNANIKLKDSLLYFEGHNMSKLAIATKITLATRLAQKGYTNDALSKLDDILNTKYISELDYIYVTNNKAVIKMFENDFQAIKVKDLINNYKYIQDEYSKLLIANNLLIYYCNIDNYDEAAIYAKILENAGFTKYKFESYLLLTYLNLKYYYQKVNANKIQYYDKKIYELLDVCKDKDIRDYINNIISGSSLDPENGLYFLSQFNYRPAFLGHWIINNFDY